MTPYPLKKKSFIILTAHEQQLCHPTSHPTRLIIDLSSAQGKTVLYEIHKTLNFQDSHYNFVKKLFKLVTITRER